MRVRPHLKPREKLGPNLKESLRKIQALRRCPYCQERRKAVEAHVKLHGVARLGTCNFCAEKQREVMRHQEKGHPKEVIA